MSINKEVLNRVLKSWNTNRSNIETILLSILKEKMEEYKLNISFNGVYEDTFSFILVGKESFPNITVKFNQNAEMTFSNTSGEGYTVSQFINILQDFQNSIISLFNDYRLYSFIA